MAGKTVTFRMARHAALKILPGRLSVASQEEPLGVVVAGIQRTSSGQSGLCVTGGAELARIVAVGTGRRPLIRLDRMGCEKSRPMIRDGWAGRVGSMTIEALGASVTRRAGPR